MVNLIDYDKVTNYFKKGIMMLWEYVYLIVTLHWWLEEFCSDIKVSKYCSNISMNKLLDYRRDDSGTL